MVRRSARDVSDQKTGTGSVRVAVCCPPSAKKVENPGLEGRHLWVASAPQCQSVTPDQDICKFRRKGYEPIWLGAIGITRKNMLNSREQLGQIDRKSTR